MIDTLYKCDICGKELTVESGGLVRIEIERRPDPHHYTGGDSRQEWELCMEHGAWAAEALNPTVQA